jgi:hypothetical protein
MKVTEKTERCLRHEPLYPSFTSYRLRLVSDCCQLITVDLRGNYPGLDLIRFIPVPLFL